LQALEQKIARVQAKKDVYIARARSAKASLQIHEIMGNLNSSASRSAWERMEEQVHQSEARAELATGMGTALGASSDVDRECP